MWQLLVPRWRHSQISADLRLKMVDQPQGTASFSRQDPSVRSMFPAPASRRRKGIGDSERRGRRKRSPRASVPGGQMQHRGGIHDAHSGDAIRCIGTPHEGCARPRARRLGSSEMPRSSMSIPGSSIHGGIAVVGDRIAYVGEVEDLIGRDTQGPRCAGADSPFPA